MNVLFCKLVSYSKSLLLLCASLLLFSAQSVWAGSDNDGGTTSTFGTTIPYLIEQTIDVNSGGNGPIDVEFFGQDCCMNDDIVEVYVDGCLIGTIISLPWGPPHPGASVTALLDKGEHKVIFANVLSHVGDGFGDSGWDLNITQLTTKDAEPLPRICKKVLKLPSEPNGFLKDGFVLVGNNIMFEIMLKVSNRTDKVWKYVTVTDNFGAELELDPGTISGDCVGNITFETKGGSDKLVLKEWDIGTLGIDDMQMCTFQVSTDLNPAGKQQYTSCSNHDINSGAVLKYKIDKPNGRGYERQSESTPSVTVSVLTADPLTGDCDGDGVPDLWEVFECGTDPHDPEDFPAPTDFCLMMMDL